MKHKVAYTEAALLAGPWILVKSLAVVELIDPARCGSYSRRCCWTPEAHDAPPNSAAKDV